ncbi:MAG TPA: class I SAM-dependent methyltransferase [archaeon]|nr:class I SAM-dependent methyltransferase [archaeon]
MRVSLVNVRKRFAKHLRTQKVENPEIVKSRLKAYKNSLRKTKTSQDALARQLMANQLKLIKKESRSLLTSKEKSELLERQIKAFTLSKKRRGFSEAFNRYASAEEIRSARRTDARKSWGVSFKAGLKQLANYYYPVNLINYVNSIKSQKPRIVEIGCGIGRAANELYEKLDGRAEIIATGVKYMPEWEGYQNTKNIKWTITSAETLSKTITPTSVDLIHSNLGFEKAFGITKAFKEAHKILKRGGVMIITSERELNIPKEFKIEKMATKQIPYQRQKYPFFVYVLRKK